MEQPLTKLWKEVYDFLAHDPFTKEQRQHLDQIIKTMQQEAEDMLIRAAESDPKTCAMLSDAVFKYGHCGYVVECDGLEITARIITPEEFQKLQKPKPPTEE